MNFTKEVKDVYFENYKTLMKGIENDTKRKIHHAHGLEDLIFFLIFLIFIYFWERERKNVSGGGTEREGDTESEAGSRL